MDEPLQKEYASEIVFRLTNLGLWADVDNGENTLPKKIRNGEIAQYNFIFGNSPYKKPFFGRSRFIDFLFFLQSSVKMN